MQKDTKSGIYHRIIIAIHSMFDQYKMHIRK